MTTVAGDDLTAELARLSKIEQDATAGPWGTLERHGRDIADEGWSEVHVVGGPDSEPLAATFISHTLETDNTEADTAFIVESRTAMPRLLAAVEAALKLADDWGAEARGIFLEAARTADAGEVGAASALQSSAADLRAAITTALTGEEAGDA